MNIICLDIDDCILPNPTLFVSINKSFNLKEESDLALQQFELNLKRIVSLSKHTNSKLFLTSSWSRLFSFDKNTSSLIPKIDYQEDPFFSSALSLLLNYLNGLFIGISVGNRDRDIKSLQSIPSNKIVVFDDFDLDNHIKENTLVFRINGSLNNVDLYKVIRFFN